MEIRQAKASEMNIVSDLARKIWPHCFAGILRADQIENMLGKIYSLDALHQDIKDGHIFWIANIDGEDVGYASAFTEDETLWLKKIYILPDIQGKGCGKALMAKILEHFPSCKKLALLVQRDNIAAQKFYKHAGFEVTGEKPVMMGDHAFVDLIMEKPL